MSDERLTYVDSSALVKLAMRESQSRALTQYLRRRQLVSSALARTEVARALSVLGETGERRADDVLGCVELVRISDRVLRAAGKLDPGELRSLDAIHLATAALLGPTLRVFVTYDDRMASAAIASGLRVHAPG